MYSYRFVLYVFSFFNKTMKSFWLKEYLSKINFDKLEKSFSFFYKTKNKN